MLDYSIKNILKRCNFLTDVVLKDWFLKDHHWPQRKDVFDPLPLFTKIKPSPAD